MKTTLKRVLSMALALVLLVGVLPMAALADEAIVDPNYKHEETTTSVFKEDLANGAKHGWVCSKSDDCDKPEAHVEVSENHYDNNCNGICDYPGCHAKDFAGAGHNLVDVAEQAATCTTAGYSAHKKCTKTGCDYTYGKETIPVDLNNHQFVNDQPVCQREGCNVSNPNYVAPTAKLVIREKGIWKYEAAGTPNSNVSIAECLTCAGINTDNVIITKILIDDEEVDNSITSFVLGASGTTINFVTEPKPTPDPDAGNGSGSGSNSDAGNGSGSGTTTNPTVNYKVYYNLNVDESTTVELGSFPAGTSMATILNQGAIKNAKFPGLFEDWFAVEGWYLNGAKVSANDVNWSLNSNIVLYAKWYQKYNYEVVLKLYTNGNTNNVVKVIDAFKYVQDDGRLSHTEVTNIAKEYIEPNNDAGLTVYGPFDANGWEQYSLYSNRLTNTEYVTVNRNGTTVVHAMVHNAKIYNSTSSTNKKADSSNPKTGDMIMMPAAVMSVSVSALAVMFYLKKKRTV